VCVFVCAFARVRACVRERECRALASPASAAVPPGDCSLGSVALTRWPQVKTLRELSHSVVSHYYWGAGTSSGVQPKHVRLLLPSGGELDDKTWSTYMDRLRSRRGGPLKREDMLL